MKYSDICGKEVINVRDGALIGLVKDLSFDPCTYVIHAIFVSPCKTLVKKILPWFFPREEIKISVNEIENISGDVILVKFH